MNNIAKYYPGNLDKIFFDEGYFNAVDRKMYYYVKDYQGSIRSVVDNYGLAEVENNNYDPTGVEFGASFDPYGRQRYKYTGQERMDEISNNFYDYHARIYMAYLGRFMQMDPMCEQRYNISPYAYCSNNSVNRVDPTGMLDWEPEVSLTGRAYYKAEQGDNIQTFKTQYGLSNKQASQIFSESGLSTTQNIEKGISISGETVQNITGNEVLKLNWSSSQATTQRRADQIMFAIKYSQMNYIGDPIVDMKDYNTNFQIGGGGINFSNITISVGDGRIPMKNMSIGFTHGNTELMNIGQPIKDIFGIDDLRQDYLSGQSYRNPRAPRSMMNLRFESKYKDRYSKYYYQEYEKAN